MLFYFKRLEIKNWLKLILFLLGKYSSRNRLSKCLYENLMNQTEYKPFHDILFDINISMKQIINPLIEHQQAIEYILINMNKKLYFMEKDFKKMEKIKIETFSEKVKKENLESIWFDVREPVESFTGRTKELDELHKEL